MGIIDWIIVILLVAFMIVGFRRGFAGMAVQLLGYIASFFLIGQYYPLIRNSLVYKYHFDGVLASILAILLILILLGVIVRLVIFLLNKTLRLVNLGTTNRLFGALFGLLNALLIVMIFCLLVDYFPGLAKPLKMRSKHKVYYEIDQAKDEVFTALKLQQRLQYIENKIDEQKRK